MKFGYTKQVDMGFDEIKNNVVDSLKSQGFGVLMEIDVKSKMKEKTGKDMENYIILGVCDPNLAYQALSEEIEIGLLLPCNIIIYTKEGKNHISAILPTIAMSFVGNDTIMDVAKEAEEKLKSIIDSF